MIRGTVYWVNLEPSHPPEFGKTRPAVIVSNSEQNERLSTVVVIPLSSQTPEIWPLRVEVKVLKKNSYAVLPGIRQVNKARLVQLVGSVSVDQLEKIDEALEAYLKD